MNCCTLLSQEKCVYEKTTVFSGKEKKNRKVTYNATSFMEILKQDETKDAMPGH